MALYKEGQTSNANNSNATASSNTTENNTKPLGTHQERAQTKGPQRSK